MVLTSLLVDTLLHYPGFPTGGANPKGGGIELRGDARP